MRTNVFRARKRAKPLDSDDVFQAEALLGYTRRGGDEARWWWSKDFSPARRLRIRAAVRRISERCHNGVR